MIEDILLKQRAFFRAGYTLNVAGRRAALQILANTIKEMEGEILDALKEDLGKSATEAYMCEVGLALSEIRDVRKRLRGWARPKRACTPLAQFPSKSRIISEPYGNVLIMAPWNYPFLLSISPLISALAAGNTVVLKPSSQAKATQAVIKRIIDETFTEDYVAVIEGDRDSCAGLLDQKFDYIFFTGSKSYGRTVMAKAAEHLTPVTLELGGKSPVIVDSECDIRVSARRLVFGKFLNVGQTCVAPDHVFVQKDIADAFVEACIEETKAMFGENTLENPDYGKIIGQRHFDRLTATLDEVSDMVEYGGRYDAAKQKIEPAFIRLGSIDQKMEDKSLAIDSYRIMQEEIFGPLLPFITYTDISDVVDYIDARPRPLAAYFFTNDSELKRELLAHLHFGGGCVNDTMIHLATERMPFGGVGESGMGSYHGKWGFDTFTHQKSIVDKKTWLDIRMRYQPYTEKASKMIRKFL